MSMTIFGMYQNLPLYGHQVSFNKLGFAKASGRRTKCELCLSVCLSVSHLSKFFLFILLHPHMSITCRTGRYICIPATFPYLLTKSQTRDYAEITLFASFCALFVLTHSNYMPRNHITEARYLFILSFIYI